RGAAQRLDQLLAARAVRADAQCQRGIEVLAEHGEDRDVPQRAALLRIEPPPQGRFLGEAELARDAEARVVTRLDPDLDPIGSADLEPDAFQSRARLGADSLPHGARSDPVADLEAARPDPRMETGAAEQLGFVGAEDAVGEVLARVEVGTEAPRELRL